MLISSGDSGDEFMWGPNGNCLCRSSLLDFSGDVSMWKLYPFIFSIEPVFKPLMFLRSVNSGVDRAAIDSPVISSISKLNNFSNVYLI